MASCFESNKGSLEDLDGRCDGGGAAAAGGGGCGELSSCALAMMEKEREPLLLSPSECPGTLGSTTPTSLLQGQADVPMQGYDVEFDPPLESKYECPICLMALRNAIQTPCGHRFCKNCIEKSIRDTGQKCPVDNEMLLEEQLFPDNFAKREILSLRVRCPNAGCADKMELRSLDNHVSQCQFATLVCPQCHQSVRKSQLEEHQSHQCLRRPVECQECMASFVYEDKQLHERQCPFANVECEYCGMELIRDQMESHCDTDCPKAPIACTFSTFGCRERMQRHDLAQHMQEFTQMHMRYMAEFVRTLSLNTASLSHQQSYGLWPPGGAAASSSSSSSVLFPGEEHGGGATACGGGGAAAAACGGAAAAAAGGAAVASCSGAAGGGGASAAGQPSEEAQRLGEMDRRLVKQDHQLRELIILKETQVGQLAELKRRVATLEDTVRELEAQQCQGIFVWRLKGFAAHLRNQEAGLPVVEHSPGFYTGRPGYKLCLRLHLQSPNAPRCSNYISLFVHTMQGAFDGQLSWPFQGTIRLAVLDQGAEGQHHMEVMETKPDLQAFQKPTIMRNPKGFGYVTFLHLQQLSQRGFVKDDTLLVRCEVTPRFGDSSSPAGSLRREGVAVQPRGPEASVLTT